MQSFEIAFAASGIAASTYVLYHLLFKRNEHRLSEDIEELERALPSSRVNSHSVSTKKKIKPEITQQRKFSLRNKETIPYIKSNSSVSIIRFLPKHVSLDSRSKSEPQMNYAPKLDNPEDTGVVEKEDQTDVMIGSEHLDPDESQEMNSHSEKAMEHRSVEKGERKRIVDDQFLQNLIADKRSLPEVLNSRCPAESSSEWLDLTLDSTDDTDHLLPLSSDVFSPSQLEKLIPNCPAEVQREEEGSNVTKKEDGLTE